MTKNKFTAPQFEELCRLNGITNIDLTSLHEAKLLNPDDKGMYRFKLLSWAKKLDYLLSQDWSVEEIKQWSKSRWSTENPRQWPPDRKQG